MAFNRNPREERKRKQLGNSLTGNTTSAQSYASNNYSQMSNSYNAQANAIKAPATQRPTGGLAPNKYQSQYEAAYNAIKDRDPFSYNQKKDPLYQQYADMYARNAKLAMQDTMGQAAALTGGYGNSYAQTAGQAMYNQAMAGLNEKALDLYNAALNSYNAEGDRLAQMYSMAADMYGNENDNLRYAAELAENQYQYDNNYAQQMREYYSDLGYKYGAMGEDARQYDQNFNENRRQFDLNYNEDKRRYDQDFEYQKYADDSQMAYNLMVNGYNPDGTRTAAWQQQYDDEQKWKERDLAYNYMVQGYNPDGTRTKAWQDQYDDEQNWKNSELAYNLMVNGYNPDGTRTDTWKAENAGYNRTVAINPNARAIDYTQNGYGNTDRAENFKKTIMSPQRWAKSGKKGTYADYIEGEIDDLYTKGELTPGEAEYLLRYYSLYDE